MYTTVDVGYKHTGYKNISDIRTLYWKTVAIYPYIIYAGYKNIYAVPDDVLITGIHCMPNFKHRGKKFR